MTKEEIIEKIAANIEPYFMCDRCPMYLDKCDWCDCEGCEGHLAAWLKEVIEE